MNTNFQLIILAAGKGSRLKSYTKKKPKSLIQFGKESILLHQIRIINLFDNIKKKILVAGYRSSEFKKISVNKIVINKEYKTSNMVWSLYKVRKFLNCNTIIAYGDIIYHKEILKKILLNKSNISLAIDKNFKSYWKKRFKNPFSDLETLKIKNGKIIEIGKKTSSYNDIDGQYIGLIKLSLKGCSIFKSLFSFNNKYLSKNELKKISFTEFLEKIIELGCIVKPVLFKEPWIEIDTINDLKNKINHQRLNKIFRH